MNSRLSGLSWITLHKKALDMSDVHEHVQNMVMPDFGAMATARRVPYLPAAAVGAALGKLTGAGIGSLKRSPWTGDLKFRPSLGGTGWGYTLGGLAGGGIGLVVANAINRVRENREKKKRKEV